MAIATVVQAGRTIDYTPGSAVDAGAVVVQVDLLGVAPLDIAANALGAIMVEGVVEVPKDTGGSTAIPVGTIVYWDVAEQEAGADDESGANKRLGKAIATAADAAATVKVLLTP